MALYLFNPSADISIYHLENMLFGLLAFIAAYLVLFWQCGKPWLALLGPVFLFLSPRFLGDIPANPKDMPFAVLYFLALTGILYFHGRKDRDPYVEGLALGVLFGLTLCTRLLGFSLFFVYFLFDSHFCYHGTKRHSWSKNTSYLKGLGLRLAIIFGISAIALFASWPYLRTEPLRHFWEIVALSKNFHWNNPVLFLGKEILAPQLPLTYLPVWLAIGTPLFILFLSGGAWFWMKARYQNALLILLTCALAVNLALYFLVHPVIYDGLRHFLFLLPILATLAALSGVALLTSKITPRIRTLILAVILLNIAATASHIGGLHPYEYVYFNELTGGLKGAQGRFETDYWDASVKEALAWIEKEGPPNGQTRTVSSYGSAWQSLFYTPSNLTWTNNKKKADHYIATSRDDRHSMPQGSDPVHIVEREGVPLCYVF